MKNGMNGHKGGQNSVTAVTFLNRAQVDYLDKLGKDCFFRYGHKLSRAKILAQLVDLLMDLHVNVRDVDLEHDTLSHGIERLIHHENEHTL